jgi:tetratricopeptide (TPR) repeat protein
MKNLAPGLSRIVALSFGPNYRELGDVLNSFAADHGDARRGARPNHATPSVQRAELNEKVLAEQELRKALELYPLNTDSRNRLGALLFKLGRTQEAEEQYLASLHSMPNGDGYDGLGDLYFEQGRRDLAEQNYRGAISENIYDHHAHFRLGLIDMDSGATPKPPVSTKPPWRPTPIAKKPKPP